MPHTCTVVPRNSSAGCTMTDSPRPRPSQPRIGGRSTRRVARLVSFVLLTVRPSFSAGIFRCFGSTRPSGSAAANTESCDPNTERDRNRDAAPRFITAAAASAASALSETVAVTSEPELHQASARCLLARRCSSSSHCQRFPGSRLVRTGHTKLSRTQVSLDQCGSLS